MKEYVEEDGVLLSPTTGIEFNFPFEPYSIQLDFMKNIFEACERGDFGIFQSPTGTGKTLSLLCGALTWLKMDKDRFNYSKFDPKGNEPKWILEQKRAKRLKQRQDEIQEIQAKYDKWEKAIRDSEKKLNLQDKRKLFMNSKKRNADTDDNVLDEKEDSEVLLNDYQSEDESPKNTADTELQRWLECKGNLYYGSDDDELDQAALFKKGYQVPPEPQYRKVIYASRTHSQLKQSLKELKKTKFWTQDKIRSITIGSRMQLCNNQDLKNSCSSANQLNEKCVELQKSNVSKAKKCSFLNGGAFTPTLDFVKKSRSDVLDIEELVLAGNKLNTCSYYGARQSLMGADIVFIPYNLLLVRGSRESLGLDLENSIIIIDEAHNLIDSICNTHGSSLSWNTSILALDLVKKYFDKYWSRLNGQNVIYIRQLIKLLKSINRFFELKSKQIGKTKSSEKDQFDNKASPGARDSLFSSFSPNDFLNNLNIGNINIFKLVKFLRVSQLSHKLNMFVDRVNRDNLKKLSKSDYIGSNKKPRQSNIKNESKVNSYVGVDLKKNESTTLNIDDSYNTISAASALASVESFIFSLGSPNSENSKIFFSLEEKEELGQTENSFSSNTPKIKFTGELKYVLMDPSDPFSDILRLPRTVILAGGTMNPINDTVYQLGLDPEAKNFNNHDLELEDKKDEKVSSIEADKNSMLSAKNNLEKSLHIREAGLSLSLIVQKTPGGVIVFFPSYHFLYKAFNQWKSEKIIDQIESFKKVFCEPKGSLTAKNNKSRNDSSATKDSSLTHYPRFNSHSSSSYANKPESTAAEVFNSYKSNIENLGGAVLFAVVSGNMSEGIDFTDNMARSVYLYVDDQINI
ncbi:ATP-dependent RNA helicase chl1 [Smittium culicis]|uniref:ATP-dependent DNA helicase CHL1 n=1 Tax=Smittium culicis TaxID=133412 RepID=A0A1R1XWA5_9FUNG|nr:ATP-dependent RNA helicase chl1 [Smittium culicis]